MPNAKKDNELYEINPINNCWEFLGHLSHNGYGQMKRKGKHLRAHRYFYEKYIGKIATNHEIDHLCKNRKCVNPQHLQEITKLENIKRSNLIKIPKQKIEEIRNLWFTNNFTQNFLAYKFNISQSFISRIVNNLRRVSF